LKKTPKILNAANNQKTSIDDVGDTQIKVPDEMESELSLLKISMYQISEPT